MTRSMKLVLVVLGLALAFIVARAGGRMGGHASGGPDGAPVGGCGGGPTGIPQPVQAAVDLAAPADLAVVVDGGGAVVTVEISPPDHDDRFYPDDVTIDRGTTVRWHWNEGGHSVTSVADPTASATPDGQFCSGANSDAGCNNRLGFDTDYVYAHTFAQPGVYTYICIFHYPMMNGVIRVR